MQIYVYDTCYEVRKPNKRNKICLNLLAILSKSGTAMAVPAAPVAMALKCTILYIVLCSQEDNYFYVGHLSILYDRKIFNLKKGE